MIEGGKLTLEDFLREKLRDSIDEAAREIVAAQTPENLRSDQAAAFLAVSPSKFARISKNIPRFRLDGTIVYHVADLREFLQKHREVG